MLQFFFKCNYILLFKKYAFGINFWPQEVLELNMSSRRLLDIVSLNTSRVPKFIPKADFFKVLNNYSSK